MSLLFLDKNYNSYNIEQRLLQKIGYSNIYNYIRELSYLGFEYSFLYPLVLTLQSTKGYFFTLPLLRINEYTNYSFSVKEYTLLYHNTTSTKLSNNYHYYNKLTSSSLPLYSFLNSLHTLIYTGAKANFSQLYQLIGIRGYLSGASKTRFNLPVLNNFNKGLNIFEYFISCLGARKGVIDTAIKTADSGYLTKRLVETTQGLIVKEYYCGTKNFCAYTSMINALGHSTFPSNLLLYGKILKTNVINLRTKEIITPKNTFLNPELLALLRVNKHKLSKLNLSSIKLCTLERTICSLCLGATTLSNNFLSRYIGIYVGQTVGEPSTQLTLRTFHTGGVSTLQTLKQQQTQETLLTYLPMNKYKICSFFKYFNLSTSPKIKTIKKLKKGSYNFLSFKRTYIKQAKIN